MEYFEAKSLLTDLSGNGQVKLSSDDVEILNKELGKSGFSDVLVHDSQPKFVVAEIVEMEDHPDSDHLHICKVNVGLLIQYKLFVVHQTRHSD